MNSKAPTMNSGLRPSIESKIPTLRPRLPPRTSKAVRTAVLRGVRCRPSPRRGRVCRHRTRGNPPREGGPPRAEPPRPNQIRQRGRTNSSGPLFFYDFAHLSHRHDRREPQEQKEHGQEEPDRASKGRPIPHRGIELTPGRGHVVVFEARGREYEPLLPHADDNAAGDQEKQELASAH